jgi:hypothetical protein
MYLNASIFPKGPLTLADKPADKLVFADYCSPYVNYHKGDMLHLKLMSSMDKSLAKLYSCLK